MCSGSILFPFCMGFLEVITLGWVAKIIGRQQHMWTHAVTWFVLITTPICKFVKPFYCASNSINQIIVDNVSHMLNRITVMGHVIRNDRNILFDNLWLFLCTSTIIKFLWSMSVENSNMNGCFSFTEVLTLNLLLITAFIVCWVVMNTWNLNQLGDSLLGCKTGFFANMTWTGGRDNSEAAVLRNLLALMEMFPCLLCLASS